MNINIYIYIDIDIDVDIVRQIDIETAADPQRVSQSGQRAGT